MLDLIFVHLAGWMVLLAFGGVEGRRAAGAASGDWGAFRVARHAW
jgi:hypothetical protein